jgi:hypothetical protein
MAAAKKRTAERLERERAGKITKSRAASARFGTTAWALLIACKCW